MGELLWSAFSHPSAIAGPGDASFIVIGAMAAALLTFAFMATAGRRIASKSRTVAVLAGTAFLPVCGIAIAYALLASAPEGPPPNDGSAMLFMALIVLSICTTPISFFTSAAYIVRRYKNGG
ncbi:hypothetical protein M0208_08775 [Sphingomonas sp. SUN019]|uniref:hypothetical protein n=1 Tax=Sphingomonas sp. SUN019 TaxID=2937788 RepID=UPI002164CCC5|nr:hypothetical protein [Sphingomonas sp. SUN019]UVO50605.1 hypothetical protein M0208_08775 [Sphingomonas sp. SUN019]